MVCLRIVEGFFLIFVLVFDIFLLKIEFLIPWIVVGFPAFLLIKQFSNDRFTSFLSVFINISRHTSIKYFKNPFRSIFSVLDINDGIFGLTSGGKMWV